MKGACFLYALFLFRFKGLYFLLFVDLKLLIFMEEVFGLQFFVCNELIRMRFGDLDV